MTEFLDTAFGAVLACTVLAGLLAPLAWLSDRQGARVVERGDELIYSTVTGWAPGREPVELAASDDDEAFWQEVKAVIRAHEYDEIEAYANKTVQCEVCGGPCVL